MLFEYTRAIWAHIALVYSNSTRSSCNLLQQISKQSLMFKFDKEMTFKKIKLKDRRKFCCPTIHTTNQTTTLKTNKTTSTYIHHLLISRLLSFSACCFIDNFFVPGFIFEEESFIRALSIRFDNFRSIETVPTSHKNYSICRLKR